MPLVNGKGDPIGGYREFDPKTVVDPSKISPDRFLALIQQAARSIENVANRPLTDGLHRGAADGITFIIRVRNGEIVTAYPDY